MTQKQSFFEKLVVANIKRVPKLFYGEEACFVYTKEGSYQLRTPEVLLNLKVGDGMLAKCGNYFLEQTKEDHKKSPKGETIVALLHPEIIKELFDSDLSISDFETDYDAKSVDTGPLMKSFIRPNFQWVRSMIGFTLFCSDNGEKPRSTTPSGSRGSSAIRHLAG